MAAESAEPIEGWTAERRVALVVSPLTDETGRTWATGRQILSRPSLGTPIVGGAPNRDKQLGGRRVHDLEIHEVRP
jgi:hypothetical protein